MNSLCKHSYPAIDEREGTEVCTLCGLVLSSNVMLEAPHNNNSYNNDNSCQIIPATAERNSTSFACPAAPEWKKSKKRSLLYRHLLDISFNGNIPVTIAADSLCNYDKLVQTGQLRITRGDQMAIIAACLYEALKYCGCARSLREIATLTGQSVTVIGKMLKRYFPSSMPISPTDMAFRAAMQIGLSRRLATQLEKRLERVERKTSVSPSTILGAHLTMLVKNEGLDISTQEICKTLGISQVAIRRYLKYYIYNKE